MTAVRISAGEASEVTRSLHAAYARERIEEVIRAVVEDALSPSRIDVLPWHDEIRFEDDLTRAVQEIADAADRCWPNGSPTCSKRRRPRWLAGSLPPRASPTSDDRQHARLASSIVGGGFAGVACARKLAASKDLHVTLIDKNDYHQFQPLLYQVATSMLAARDDRLSAAQDRGGVRRRSTPSAPRSSPIDPVARTVTTSTGETYAGDYLVLAAGSQPNFFGTPGAEHAFPLYSLDDADRLRTRIIQAFEEADRDPHLVDEGAIDFVIVGGGPTGVEVAGALSEMINTTMVHEFPALAPRAKVRLVDHGKELLKMFADKGHAYAARVLEKDGVELLLGTGVKAIGPGSRDAVGRIDDQDPLRHLGRWPDGRAGRRRRGLPQGRGGRIDVQPDFTVAGFPGVLVIGDIANIPAKDGKTHPQLGSVALQSGGCGRQDRSSPTGRRRAPSRSPTSTRGRWR